MPRVISTWILFNTEVDLSVLQIQKFRNESFHELTMLELTGLFQEKEDKNDEMFDRHTRLRQLC